MMKLEVRYSAELMSTMLPDVYKRQELTSAAVAVRIRLEPADGTLLAQQTAQAAETGKMQFSVPDAQPWDTEHPVLHHGCLLYTSRCV